MYASNRDVGEVPVFDTATNVPLTTILVGNDSDNLGLAVSPDGNLVYVANQMSGTVTVIYAPTNTVEQIIPTGLEPIWVTFSPDGSRAYVSNQGSGSISINLATNMIVNSISTGANPREIALTPDGSRAYVTDWFSNTVDVIDVDAQSNLNTPITVGSQPWGIAMTLGGKAYVANFGDGTISVIDSATNMVTATLPTRVFPEDLKVSASARPRVLNYKFQSIAPPGSPFHLFAH